MKYTKLSLVAGAGFVLVSAGGQVLAQTEVVFDNSANLINKTPNFFTQQEYGDELFLAGRARSVTEFDFAYYGNFGTNRGVGYSLRFYANDGSAAAPGAPRPQSQLWDSGPQDLSNGINKVGLPVPNILVPDHFTWTITLHGLDGSAGKQAALMLADPATIGALLAPATATLPALIGSYDDFWKNDVVGDVDQWKLYTFGPAPTDPKGNFFAKVIAQPYELQLRIDRGDGVVVLSWPAGALGYLLEGSSDLSKAGKWDAIPTVPTNIGGINYVTNSAADARFFRLHRP